MTSDREWEDHLMGNPASPYPRVQDIQRTQNESKKLTETGGPSFGGGSNPLEGLGSIIAAPFLLAGLLSMKITHKVFLFRWLIQLGQWVSKPSRNLALGLAGVGIIVGGCYVLSPSGEATVALVPIDEARAFLEVYGVWIGCAAGAMAGWFSLPIMGSLMQAAAHIVAYCLALTLVAILIGIAYSIAAAIFDWPQVWPWVGGDG